MALFIRVHWHRRDGPRFTEGGRSRTAPARPRHLLRHGPQLVDLEHARDLAEPPLDQPEVVAGDQRDRCQRLGVGAILRGEAQPQIGPLVGRDEAQFRLAQRPLAVDVPDPRGELFVRVYRPGSELSEPGPNVVEGAVACHQEDASYRSRTPTSAASAIRPAFPPAGSRSGWRSRRRRSWRRSGPPDPSSGRPDRRE